ncbi:hypothetical protein FOMPIDRAFT_93963 [Fomitopsis schrenkii]|uniref:DUF6532 domain-containing protein n=1 Tax=Fomitopsis schrenkii TaxID=2126942 RepID=S8FJZ5_FOMSC|nr:hypothetical protein FOMPIDRAFT_93963 [Fomitopsis schrenkii]
MSPPIASTTTGRQLRSDSKAGKQAPMANSSKTKATKASGSTGKSAGKKRRKESDSEDKIEKATKKKESMRKAKVRQTTAAMAVDEQSSDSEGAESADISPPRHKRSTTGRGAKGKSSGAAAEEDEEEEEDKEEEEEDEDEDEEEDEDEDDGSGEATSPRRSHTSRQTGLDEDEAHLAKGLGPPSVEPRSPTRNIRFGPPIKAGARKKGRVRLEAEAVTIAGKGKHRGREEDGLRDPEEHETWLKKPAWLATTTAEYHGGQEPSTGDEVDELEPEHGDSSDSDVKIVSSSKDKGKAKAGSKGRKRRSKARDDSIFKGDSRGRVMLRELPAEVRSIVSRANTFLRLRISLEHAWTQEKKITHDILPEKHIVIQDAIGDVWEMVARERKERKEREGKERNLKHLELGFDKLNNPEEGADARKDVCNLLWTGAAQLRNQVKKEAKSVVEDAYGLKNLPEIQRVSAALFLLKYNTQGNNAIPNFVFADVKLSWEGDEVDTRESTVNRKQPFQHAAIFTLIAQYWFSSQREGLLQAHWPSSKIAKERFLEMPDNLIVFACNAIETALADIATGVHQFTNKVYAPKWVNLMDLLKVMKSRAPAVHAGIKEFIATSVRNTVAAQATGQKQKLQEDADAGEGDFMSWKEIEVTAVAGPSGVQASSVAGAAVGRVPSGAAPTSTASPVTASAGDPAQVHS